ncbi:hypothetical protein B4113_1419 [Geobacillus sp. B4113_201601]|nr:hypothetical protein B4113_1419 [Geobacillus sp. B4113_201601]
MREKRKGGGCGGRFCPSIIKKKGRCLRRQDRAASFALRKVVGLFG